MRYVNQSTILYVEDDKTISKSFCSVGESIFKNIYVAYNGKDGLDIFKQHKNDIEVIITDINMPVMDGIEMIQKIREIDFDIPIIITSAYNDNVTLNKAINLNVEGFINKPFSYHKIALSVEKVLRPIYYKRELEYKNQLLFQQSKFAAMGEMIGNIAHQWRQPLNSIGTTMMKLEFQSQSDNLTKEAVEDAINKTNNIINYMSKTIDDFRNFFSPNKEITQFTLQNTINEILELLMPQLNKNHISLEITSDENIDMYGYPNELKQVIVNILNNAKDAIIAAKIQNGLISILIEKTKPLWTESP